MPPKVDRVSKPPQPVRPGAPFPGVGNEHFFRFVQQHLRVLAQLARDLQLLGQAREQHVGVRGEDAGKRRVGFTLLGQAGVGIQHGECFSLEHERRRHRKGRHVPGQAVSIGKLLGRCIFVYTLGRRRGDDGISAHGESDVSEVHRRVEPGRQLSFEPLTLAAEDDDAGKLCGRLLNEFGKQLVDRRRGGQGIERLD